MGKTQNDKRNFYLADVAKFLWDIEHQNLPEWERMAIAHAMRIYYEKFIKETDGVPELVFVAGSN